MGFAVYHLQKGKGSGSGLGHHIDRDENKKYVFPNANPFLTAFNRNIEVNKYCQMPLWQGIDERIKDGYTGKTAIRKDAVRYITHILTGSHDKMIEITRDERSFEQWKQKNIDFVCDTFGKENIIRLTLHMDEKTPHFHCVTVPLVDGRLSAREVVGNNKNLQKLQDTYAEYMSEFNLERGIRGSKAKHTDLKEFYSRINESKEIQMSEVHVPEYVLAEPPLLNRSRWREETKEQINAFVKEQVKRQKDVAAELLELSSFKTADEKIKEKEYRRLHNEIKKLEEKNQELRHKVVNLVESGDREANLRICAVENKAKETIKEAEEKIKQANVLVEDYKVKISAKDGKIAKLTKYIEDVLIDALISVAKGTSSAKDVQKFLEVNKIFTMKRNNNINDIKM